MKRIASGLVLAALALAAIGAAAPSGRKGVIINVMDLHAVADGTTDCSDAIAKAIDIAAGNGGGIVEFPAGTYLTGRIKLQSNITLQIDEGATLKFSTDRSKYPLEKTRYECTDVMNYSPLIYAYQCKNIAITGKGTIDGQGQAWWTWSRTTFRNASAAMKPFTNDREGKYPIEQRVFGEKVQGLRPTFIEPYECDGVRIEGITIKESPFWNIHPLYSKNITVKDVTVFGDGPNTDGCDPDSSTDMVVEGCSFTTGDDCIAIKSGRDGDGLRVNRPTENLTIRDCKMFGGHGAVAIGSETSGGIKKVLVENCLFDGPDSGVRIKSTRGRGGVVEDITFKNCTINNTKKFPITLDMKYANPRDTSTQPLNEGTPVFRNITLEDLKCDGAPQAMWVVGLPESPVTNLVMKNVTISADKGAHLENVKGLVRDNVKVTAKTGEAWMMTEVTEGKE